MVCKIIVPNKKIINKEVKSIFPIRIRLVSEIDVYEDGTTYPVGKPWIMDKRPRPYKPKVAKKEVKAKVKKQVFKMGISNEVEER